MEDREIVAFFIARNEAALTETEKKYGRLLKQLALGVLRSEEDAEEVVNDAYLSAWNAVPAERPLYLGAYLCRVVRNAALSRLRWKNAAKRGSECEVCIDELTELLPANETVEQRFDADETARLIDRFLYGKKKRVRQIFLRRYWFFDTPEEIAERYGMKPNTVKSILYRTRLQLFEYLKEEGVDL